MSALAIAAIAAGVVGVALLIVIGIGVRRNYRLSGTVTFEPKTQVKPKDSANPPSQTVPTQAS